eukprot:246466_1
MGSTKSNEYRESNTTQTIDVVNKQYDNTKIFHLISTAKIIVCGYLKQIKTHPILDIVSMISSYYMDSFASNIHVVQDGRSIKKCQTDSKYSSCIFGNEISLAQCNEYQIEFEWTKRIYSFCMGFIQSGTYNAFDSTKPIGHKTNKGIGILVRKDCECMYLYNGGYDPIPLTDYQILMGMFRQNDIFKLVINFKLNFVSIWHNDVHAVQIHLNQIGYSLSNIRIAFSLSQYEGEQIEVIKTNMK